MELNKPLLLSVLLQDLQDINIKQDEGGQALLHAAAENGKFVIFLSSL